MEIMSGNIAFKEPAAGMVLNTINVRTKGTYCESEMCLHLRFATVNIVHNQIDRIINPVIPIPNKYLKGPQCTLFS